MVKVFIVHRLARYDTPSMVQRAVREQFGIEIKLPALGHYDPTTRQGRKLGKRWREIFFEEREKTKAQLREISE